MLTVERSIGQRGGQTWEKDTKTHQQRRLALDAKTVALLARAPPAVRGATRPRSASSFRPTRSCSRRRPTDRRTSSRTLSASVTRGSPQRLGHQDDASQAAALLGDRTHRRGVDVRTVAGRLGHGGGGTTTLRVYTAWVSEADQRASNSLFSRLPEHPARNSVNSSRDLVPRHPYERLAVAIRDEITGGRWRAGDRLPTFADLAHARDVSPSTVQRAIKLLGTWGYIDVVIGRGVFVRRTDNRAEVPSPAGHVRRCPAFERTPPRRDRARPRNHHTGAVSDTAKVGEQTLCDSPADVP